MELTKQQRQVCIQEARQAAELLAAVPSLIVNERGSRAEWECSVHIFEWMRSWQLLAFLPLSPLGPA